MGTAEFDMTMTLRGTQDEMRAMLKEFIRYCGGDTPAYFSMPSAMIGDERVVFDLIDKAKIESIMESIPCELEISACGPYGRYRELNDVDTFRDMSSAAPNAYFTAHIGGFTAYDSQSLDCELKDGRLHITTSYLSNEEGPEEYCEYFMERLPYEEFIDMFSIDPSEFDESDYAEFVEFFMVDEDEGLLNTEYEDFIAEIGEGCVGVDEEGYAEALARFAELGIESYDEFNSDDLGDQHKYEYDPIAGRYVGPAKSERVKILDYAGGATDVNEEIREYLRVNGLPCDDAAIAALSVEDAYAVLAGTYGKDNAAPAEETQDEPEDADEALAAELVIESEPAFDEKAADEPVAAADESPKIAAAVDEPASETEVNEENADVSENTAEEPVTEEAVVGTDTAETEAAHAAEQSAAGEAPAADPAAATEQAEKRGKAWIAWLIAAVLVAAAAAVAVLCPCVTEAAVSAITALFE